MHGFAPITLLAVLTIVFASCCCTGHGLPVQKSRVERATPEALALNRLAKIYQRYLSYNDDQSIQAQPYQSAVGESSQAAPGASYGNSWQPKEPPQHAKEGDDWQLSTDEKLLMKVLLQALTAILAENGESSTIKERDAQGLLDLRQQHSPFDQGPSQRRLEKALQQFPGHQSGTKALKEGETEERLLKSQPLEQRDQTNDQDNNQDGMLGGSFPGYNFGNSKKRSHLAEEPDRVRALGQSFAGCLKGINCHREKKSPQDSESMLGYGMKHLQG